MVAVLHAAPETSAPQAIAAWLAGLRGIYPDDDLSAIEAAFVKHSGRYRAVLSTRVKMGQSSNVYALVKADDPKAALFPLGEIS